MSEAAVNNDDMLLAALDRLASEHAVRSSVPPDPDRASRNTCFVCGQPNPAYLSTNKHPEDAAPVPVCGVACAAQCGGAAPLSGLSCADIAS